MKLGKHGLMELGNPNQGPGKHREHEVDKGRYGVTLGRPERCPEEYYLFDIDRTLNNDPNSRR